MDKSIIATNCTTTMLCFQKQEDFCSNNNKIYSLYQPFLKHVQLHYFVVKKSNICYAKGASFLKNLSENILVTSHLL